MGSHRAVKFPLWWHERGGWTKKIRQRLHYFGRDRDTALAEYVRVKSDLEAGRAPRSKSTDDVTVARVCNSFLTAKRQRVDSGELSARMWSEYHATADRVCSQFGKERIVADLRPEDFAGLRAEAAERLGVFALTKFVQMVRSFFIHAYDHGLVAGVHGRTRDARDICSGQHDRAQPDQGRLSRTPGARA